MNEADLQELINELKQPDPDEQGSVRKSAERVAFLQKTVGIFVYGDEGKHKNPHFHARFNDDEKAVFYIHTLDLIPETVCTLRKSHLNIVRKWIKGNVAPAPDAPENAPVITRQHALLEAWNQARAGTAIVHVASTSNVPTISAGDAGKAIDKFAVQVYALSNDTGFDEFRNTFSELLLIQAVKSGIAVADARHHIARIIAKLEDAVHEALKELHHLSK